MKLFKRICIVGLLVGFCTTITICASAHSQATGCKHESAYTGWDIYEDSVHCASYNEWITVDKGPFSDDNFGKYITSAVSSWNDATFNGSSLLKMKESSSGFIVFKNKTNKQMSAINRDSSWGCVRRGVATYDTTTNHYSTAAGSVEVWINWNDILSKKSSGCSTHTALHELGHVIGLKDISEDVSPNAYLMCNGFGSSYSIPKSITENDKQGAAVILGQHTSHSFQTYKKHNATYHRTTCTVCGIYKLEKHQKENGACKYCGQA
ncbi:MAG: hypothetical protein NC084_13765 [Bacteroides sp.]|nr:hypothetical protein [Eubacterium sp.]MCM1419752.1 hypothetical protein [Roseburia sp.]MCM1463764.1 hypothetical protein [Bacteroides sp.]